MGRCYLVLPSFYLFLAHSNIAAPLGRECVSTHAACYLSAVHSLRALDVWRRCNAAYLRSRQVKPRAATPAAKFSALARRTKCAPATCPAGITVCLSIRLVSWHRDGGSCHFGSLDAHGCSPQTTAAPIVRPFAEWVLFCPSYSYGAQQRLFTAPALNLQTSRPLPSKPFTSTRARVEVSYTPRQLQGVMQWVP